MQDHKSNSSPSETPALNPAELASSRHLSREYPSSRGTEPRQGYLIINADDWGVNKETTNRTLDCIRRGTVSAVSAMVFMDDSTRSAEKSLEMGVDTGLHLNLSAPFTSSTCPTSLREHHEKIAFRLRRHALSRLFYYPDLARSFEYVVATQLDEFRRLYGSSRTALMDTTICTSVPMCNERACCRPEYGSDRIFHLDPGKRTC